MSLVVRERLIGLLLMALLPMMPAYWLAALCYLLRSALSRGSTGAQQALTVGIVREERRGLAASLNTISTQVPRAAGPVITGVLLGLGQFSLPCFAPAGLQGLYLMYYRRVFRAYEPSRRRSIVRHGLTTSVSTPRTPILPPSSAVSGSAILGIPT